MATQTPPAGYSIPTSSSSSSSSKTYQKTHLPRHQSHPHVSLSSSAAALPQPHRLSHHFRGHRSTRFVSKLHFNRPNLSSPGPARHSSAADQALNLALNLPLDHQDSSFETLLLSFAPRLAAPDDYSFLLRELGNRGHLPLVLRCFRFAVAHASSAAHQGKLVSAAISVLGRLGRVDLARSLFDSALASGYGNTVYAYSALISAYARSGRARDAIRLFDTMKAAGLTPNLVTYNAVIDACGKGGVDFRRTLSFFDEMVNSGVTPDRITFNSLLAVCSRGGLWEEARELFDRMSRDGVDRDLFTYNTLLDAVCKGGQMDLSMDIMSDMYEQSLFPNVVTYSTLIDGFAKAGRLDEALNLFRQMKEDGIKLDRVSYNTLVSIYAKLGRFPEALGICMEMESAGIRKDVVTYNALISGYGKKDNYGAVNYLFEEMKADGCTPNVLTYSTLIDCYAKMGRRKEAMAAFEEFRKQGMKADVVLYSAFIDALCKIGMVQTAVSLLDEMIMEGIKPNVVTCNSIIDAFCRPDSSGGHINAVEGDEISGTSSMRIYVEDKSNAVLIDGDNNHAMSIFDKQLIVADNDKPAALVVDDVKIKTQDIICILSMFHKMQELDIKPNVVTFSAILSACSRCNSFEDASMLLEKLRVFDSQVYGVTHGLLMGCGEKIWLKAEALFDEMKCMDSSTASAFYNALTDVLWHFGQRRGAQLVVLEGKRRQAWENLWCNESCLDLHLMSLGAAQAMVHAWLLGIRSVVFNGKELPELVSILTGWGKHSKVPGDSTLRHAVDALLTGIGAPFHVAKSNVGRLVSAGPVVAAWLRESSTLKVLILHDRTNLANNYHALPELLMVPLS